MLDTDNESQLLSMNVWFDYSNKYIHVQWTD